MTNKKKAPRQAGDSPTNRTNLSRRADMSLDEIVRWMPPDLRAEITLNFDHYEIVATCPVCRSEPVRSLRISRGSVSCVMGCPESEILHALPFLVSGPLQLSPVTAVSSPSGDPSGETKPDETRPASSAANTATVLVKMAELGYTLGQTTTGEPFGYRHGSHVVMSLRGGRMSLRAELAEMYYRAHKKTASSQALSDALVTIEGICLHSAPREVGLRVARAEGAVWIDLADEGDHVVRLDATGWQVMSTCPVLFRRTELTSPMPCPVAGESLKGLWTLVNIPEVDRPLVVAWLVAAVAFPGVAHPALLLAGEQGSAKTTTSRVLADLVDPSIVHPRSAPKDVDEWVTTCNGSWVVALDNLSNISVWLSDSMCRAVTGDAATKRTLYTTDGISVFQFRRAVICNWIDVGALRSDLADRAVLVTLPRITQEKRRTDEEVFTDWKQRRPGLFGALLTLASTVLATPVHLAEKPRMADYAQILASVDLIGSTAGLARFTRQAERLNADVVTSVPFLACMGPQLRTWIHTNGLDVLTSWRGTSAELLDVIEPPTTKQKSWPENARAVTSLLTRNAPALRANGWQIDNDGGANKKGITVWDITPPADRELVDRDEEDTP